MTSRTFLHVLFVAAFLAFLWCALFLGLAIEDRDGSKVALYALCVCSNGYWAFMARRWIGAAA